MCVCECETLCFQAMLRPSRLVCVYVCMCVRVCVVVYVCV